MSSDSTTRILIVDDHFVVRSGIKASLEMEDDFEIVCESEDSAQAQTAYKEHTPDLVLLDFQLPDQGGTATTKALLKLDPNARILVFSTYDKEEDIFQTIQAGAMGYLLKSVPRSELLVAIRTVAKGERYLSAEVSNRLANRLASTQLSEREIEIVGLIAQGQSNKQIGNQLSIAEDTVKRHVSHILVKLKVADRAQAATEALRRGLIKL